MCYNKQITGGWEGSVVFEITFKDGGAIELGQKLIDIASKR